MHVRGGAIDRADACGNEDRDGSGATKRTQIGQIRTMESTNESCAKQVPYQCDVHFTILIVVNIILKDRDSLCT